MLTLIDWQVIISANNDEKVDIQVERKQVIARVWVISDNRAAENLVIVIQITNK